MIRKIIFSLLFVVLSGAVEKLNAQICTPDTSLRKAGYKPAALPVVKQDSQYNESITVLVKRDTYRMVGATKINVKIDSVKATSVIGLPSGYSYKCQHPRCVFLWDTVRCVTIFGKTSQSGTFPILIPVIGYAKIGSSSLIQSDTIRDFTLIVEGDPASVHQAIRLQGWTVKPMPVQDVIKIYSEKHEPANAWKLYTPTGKELPVKFEGNNGIYTATTQNLSAGIYLIGNGNVFQKIIISAN